MSNGHKPNSQPKQRGLGLHSHSKHSSAAYISSLSVSGACSPSSKHLAASIKHYNEPIPHPDDALALDHLDVLKLPVWKKLKITILRGRLIWHGLLGSQLFLPLGSISHIDPAEFQTGVKWWLGIAITDNPLCPFCPSHALDAWGSCGLTSQQTQGSSLRILPTGLSGSSC